LKIGERFHPHPSMKKVYYIYLAIVVIPLLVLSSGITLAVYYHSTNYVLVPILVLFIPVIAIAGFIAYWIPKYYRSITYTLGEEEVMVERGVWWKMKHAVPYARMMSVDTVQGPISRHFGIGTADIHTAGYTATGGGTSGPGTRRAEASIMHVPNFVEIRDMILSIVRGRPLFAAPKVRAGDVGSQILSELRKVRKVLEKSRR